MKYKVKEVIQVKIIFIRIILQYSIGRFIHYNSCFVTVFIVMCDII